MFEEGNKSEKLADLKSRQVSMCRYFDYTRKSEKLAEVTRELENPKIWDDPKKAQDLGRERVNLENIVYGLDNLATQIADTQELLLLAEAEKDEDLFTEIRKEILDIESKIEQLEFQRMFSGKMDANGAYLDIQSGSGGTEAQDWAEMILRMFLRFGDKMGFKTELMEVSGGDVAGIKSATIKFTGEYAYGWLKTETGVHRLVRKSPFDSGNRRHTSFASVFVYPEIDEDFDIDINPADLRVDTYRSSGAGGQHVNTTDSAIRITHIPTNTVVQCQSDRSQHKNRAQAMSQLKSKLYELELNKKNSEKQQLEDNKMEISWGSQIRSYVLDASRIKDLRTGHETGNTQAVLDGDLKPFISATLKQLGEENE